MAATPKPLTGAAAVAALQKQVSPKGVASMESKALKALNDKYPNLYLPQIRTTAGVKK
jgi:hypothetical protein